MVATEGRHHRDADGSRSAGRCPLPPHLDSLYSSMRTPWKRAAILVWRAFGLRCPNCGGGPIFESWLRIRPRCPVCRLRLERGEEGYQVGAYMFNIVASELVFVLIFLGVLMPPGHLPPGTCSCTVARL
jgi:hypothetical protein